ncbi:hypothetical protein QEN19_001582 [Hanseniaspora menglaensis]
MEVNVKGHSIDLEMEILKLLKDSKISIMSYIKTIFYTVLIIFFTKKLIKDNFFYRKNKKINKTLYNLQEIIDTVAAEVPSEASKHGNIHTISPINGYSILKDGISPMTKTELKEKIRLGKIAQASWKRTTVEERTDVLQTIYEFLLANQEDIVKICSIDSGKLSIDASLGEILVTFEKLKWTINNAAKILKAGNNKTNFAGSEHLFMGLYKGTKVINEPLGLVSAVVSWNYPFHNLINPIIPAIVTGNAVIVKCSEQVIFSSQIFMNIFKEALIVNGFDPELINLFYCLPPKQDETDSVCDYFTKCNDFKHLTFIGSKEVATMILHNLADVIIPNVMELGGKDCFIVLDSWKDLDMISSIIMRGTFQSSGQNCIGIERVIVQPKNYENLINILNERIATMQIGTDILAKTPVDIGAMISDNRFERLEFLVQDAIKNGARLLKGGKRFKHPQFPKGFFFEPTLLVDVNENCLISEEEVFGPILCVIKGDTNIGNLVKQANSENFGLGSSIFGLDDFVNNHIAENLTTGNVAINDFATYYPSNLPFGGYPGKSGYGKFGGSEGLLGLTNSKSISFNKFSWLKTKIPGKIDYPIKNNNSAWWFIKNLNILSYADSNWEKFKSILNLCKDKK